MDRITLTLLLVFLLHLYCAAQFSIKGRVLSADKSTPIAGASIFFNHASFGAATNEDGLFHFSSVKSGQYELVVSAIGYEAQVQNLLVDNDVTLADIVLKPKSIGLKEVKIRPGFDREKYYQIFKQRFLGLSDNARQCQILNPDILDIDYDSHKLTVGADQILLIENKILGYKIKYLLKDFTLDGNDGTLFYNGYVSFENLKESASQQKRWEKNRLKTYLGSQMHFLRSLLGNQLTEEGYKVLKLRRTPVVKKISDSVIRSKVRYYKAKSAKNSKLMDSLFYWAEMLQMPKNTDKLIDSPLTITDMLKRTDQKIIYALANPDCLYVIYTKRKDYYTTFAYRPYDMPKYPVSIITFKSRFLFFDINGGIINPESAFLEGYWGEERVADSLPVDYEPGETNEQQADTGG